MLIYSHSLGTYDWRNNTLWGASFRIKRDASVSVPMWVPNDEYANSRPCLAIPGPLWDLLHSGLGLRDHCIRCRKCGTFEHTDRQMESKMLEAERLRFCFECLFWLGKAKLRRRDPNFCVIAGGAYYIGEEHQREGAFRGFGGAPHTIRFLADGRIVHTTNLWSNGTVPEHWRAFLPDSAEFVRVGATPREPFNPKAAFAGVTMSTTDPTNTKASPLIRVDVEKDDLSFCELEDDEGIAIWLALEATDPFIPEAHTYDICVASGTPEETISHLKSLIDGAQRTINQLSEKYGVAT